MAVYVSVKKTNNIPYVYVVETFYEPNLKGIPKRKQRILLSLGRLAELEKKEPNVLERLEREYSTKGQLKAPLAPMLISQAS